MIKFLRRDEGPSDPADPANSPTKAAPAAPDQKTPNEPPSRDDGLGVPPFSGFKQSALVPPANQSMPANPGGFGNQNTLSAQSLESWEMRQMRETQDKETTMARSPFTSSQNPGASSPLPGSSSPMPGGAFRPNAPRSAEPAERRTLVVGRGISVQGVVQDAERLVVEGTVEATMIHATELSIAQGGVFKGEVEVEEAEIAGTIDGTLTARHALIVRGTGRVLGIARCKRLQVEDGGQITGRIEMMTDTGGAQAE